MELSHEEITNALSVIREVCRSSRGCKVCPLYSIRNDDCVLSDTPGDMIIADPNLWRAVL